MIDSLKTSDSPYPYKRVIIILTKGYFQYDKLYHLLTESNQYKSISQISRFWQLIQRSQNYRPCAHRQ